MAVIVLSKSPFTNWDGVKVEDVELEIVVIVVLIIYDYYDQDFCDDIKRLNNMEFKTQMFEGSYGFLMCNNICYCKNDDFTTKLMIEYMRKFDSEIDDTLKAIEKVKLLIKEYQEGNIEEYSKETLKYIRRLSFF